MRFSLIRLSPGQSTGRIPQRHLGLATGPSDPRGSSTRRSWPLRSHTRLEALRYDGLCCPRRSSLVRPPPTSARRSATSRAALIGFAVTGSPKAASPEAGDSGAETDLSCSVLDCVIVPLPLRRRVSGAAFQGLHTVHGLHPGGLGLGTRMFPAHARVLHDADTGFLSYGPITCSPPQRRLCHGASTVRSPLPPATSYGAAWPLPRPDSHRQAQHSFQDTHPRRTYERDH